MSSPHKSHSPTAPPASEPAPRRGRKARPIEEFPAPLFTAWEEPATFADALQLHMRRHGDNDHHLARVLTAAKIPVNLTTLRVWRKGEKIPLASRSFRVLASLEHRYRLAPGYFRDKLPSAGRSATISRRMEGISRSERRRLAWHLPEDFDTLPRARREEVLHWVRTVVLTGATEYRRYQADAMKHRFGLRFLPAAATRDLEKAPEPEGVVAPAHAKPADGSLDAPPQLNREMAELVRFKSATLTQRGVRRSGVWNEATVAQKLEHLGLLFGALVAPPEGPVRGFGTEASRLTLALLVFAPVWDWYLRWREARRSFFTMWEADMLALGAALTRPETGWIRQSPDLAATLEPIPGLVSPDDIAAARGDWQRANDDIHRHLLHRAKEVQRVARVHRDPFEPILVILESENPLGAYRKITEEILLRQPDAHRYPLAAAESCRAFVMLRVGLHLGVRQKNLRQLLFCGRGQIPTPERKLELLKRGELRWSSKEGGWEVVIPAAAFKNAGSSYFGQQPFRLTLPDLGDLYAHIEAYVTRHRPRLLGAAADPGTFFIKTVKRSSSSAEYDQNTFYDAWRLTVQRYGVFNPYTGRGAIEGLLPHGPHSVRDVLATHILKKTGSYEQASYAIQDTPETVAKHYGRFLPKDKASLAASVLNKVWSDGPPGAQIAA